MTRKQIGATLDRMLGGSSTEYVIRELRRSIVRTREARSHPRRLAAGPVRDLVDTLARVRVATNKRSR